MPKSWILVSSDHNTFTQFSSESLANFRRAVHVLSWAGRPCGHCRISVLHGVVCYQLFSWWLWFQLPWDHWQDPPVSSGLIPHRSHDHWNSTRWILHGAPNRGRLTVICVSSIVNNHTNCCHFSPSCLAMSCSPFQPCVGLQSCPWHPWTALWSWPWWRVWNLMDWLLLWTGVFIQVTSSL